MIYNIYYTTHNLCYINIYLCIYVFDLHNQRKSGNQPWNAMEVVR